jgi:hypothetical protein
MVPGMSDDAEIQWSERLAAACSPPSLVGSGAVLAAATTRTAFLVDRAIPARAITLILGPPGSGKSWLAYSLALSVARGERWLGIDPPCRRGSALILNYDNPTPEMGRRFARLGMTAEDPIWFHSVERNQLTMPAASGILAAMASKPLGADGRGRGGAPASLILIDSFRRSHTLDENDSTQMAQLMGDAKLLCSSGASVVILHHTTKGENPEVRGSGEILGSADASIQVKKGIKGNEQQAVWTKNRGWVLSAKDATIRFSVEDRGIGKTVVIGDGDKRTPDPEAAITAPDVVAEVRDHLASLPDGAPRGVRAVAAALGRDENAVRAALKTINSGPASEGA